GRAWTGAGRGGGKRVGSNERMKSTPLRPETAASQLDATSFPIGVIAPSPVTTTRLTARIVRVGLAPMPGKNVPSGHGGTHGSERGGNHVSPTGPLLRVTRASRGWLRPD